MIVEQDHHLGMSSSVLTIPASLIYHSEEDRDHHMTVNVILVQDHHFLEDHRVEICLTFKVRIFLFYSIGPARGLRKFLPFSIAHVLII